MNTPASKPDPTQSAANTGLLAAKDAATEKQPVDFWKSYGSWGIVVLVLVGCLIALYFDHGWRWVLGLLPAALVLQHAVYLMFVRAPLVRSELTGSPDSGSSEPQPRSRSTPAPPATATTAQQSVTPRTPRQLRVNLIPARKKVQSQTNSFFDRGQIARQYALLIIFLGTVGAVLVTICCDPPLCLKPSESPQPGAASEPLSDSTEGGPTRTDNQPKTANKNDVKSAKTEAPSLNAEQQATRRAADETHSAVATPVPKERIAYLTALRLGAAGAFVYVLIYLGRRNFQRDITGGAALWSTVQLVLGPALAMTIAYFLTPSGETTGPIGFAAIYFVAGISPRLIADWITDTVQKTWITPGATVPARRVVPLGQVRGITQSIESRLNEEGIEDAADLAMANAVKLLRNTPFDPRQILSWIDEAILITTLPLHWEALEKEGITGAMDLAWYVQEDDDDETPVGASPDRPAPAGLQQPQIQGPVPGDNIDLALLAGRIKIERDTLFNVALRLLGDNQLQMVMAMYQSNADYPALDGGS
jgi:hypothetical protein